MAESGRHAARRLRGRAIVTALTGIVSIGALTAAVSTVLVARIVVTPQKSRRENVTILGVDRVGSTVTLGVSPDTTMPGRYGLWFSLDSGYARLGDILSSNERTVTRRLLGVETGDLTRATRGRFTGWFFRSPEDLGFPFEEVEVQTSLGPAPAWLIPAAEPSSRWVVLVHGRGVKRPETLRAVRVFREAGFTSLLVSWRNDGDAPASLDGRYALGGTEWLDVDAGIRFAVEHGATDVVLTGWSMGGAAVLQAATRSEFSDVVRGIVLESPVVDWVPTLDFQARQMRVPRPQRRAVLALLGSRRAHRLTGQDAAIDFRSLDFVHRATELTVPVLLMHSVDDGYVPSTASRLLAAARPDLVTLHHWSGARHAKLWNYDSERFEREIAEWLATLMP